MRTLVENPVFVTPHALERFKTRVTEWSDDEIIDWIQSHLQRLPDEAECRQGTLMYGLTCDRRPITVVVGKGEGEWPAVVSVYGDQERLNRQKAWRGHKWTSKDSRRLRVLREYGFTPEQCAYVMEKPVSDIRARW